MIDLVAAAIIHCTVTNQSSLLKPREVTKITRVCNDYAKIVQSVWHKPRAILKVYLVDKLEPQYSKWAGYHATGGIIKVNVKLWYGLGYKDIYYPLTHEVAEATVMYNPSPDGSNEIADPIGQDYFIMNGIKVSQFLTPDGTEFKENEN